MSLARRLLLPAVLTAALCAVAPAAAQAAPPDGLTGMALDGRVELAWQPVTGATGYTVYRGTSPAAVTQPLLGSPMTPPGVGVPASFTDGTAANGTTYYYAVRAIVAGVESGNSRLVAATPRARSCAAGNPVVLENCFPGDAGWEAATASGVDGYATAQSIQHGGSVDLKVQAPAGTTVDLHVYRSGFYGGAGARLFSTILDVPVVQQPGCVTDPNLGLLDCSNWSVTHTLTTTTAWPSGVYLIRVQRDDTGRETHILLTVRDDGRPADVLFSVPDTTYQAYNNYGGKSLYRDKSTGNVTVSGTTRAVKVSYDRPYQQPHESIQHDWYTRSDYATVAWLERSGYDVAYTAVSDLERAPERLLTHRLFISGAHDEYYSAAMRTALEQARQQGVDLLFTGANGIFWRVRFEPSPVSGRADRVLVSYKSSEGGPADPSGIPTGTWRDPAGSNRPENALIGGQYIGQEPFSYYPMRVTAAEGADRLWRYTGLDNQPAGTSTTFGSGLVGWEWDARVSNGAEPPGVTTLSSSPASGSLLQDAGATYAPGSAISNAVKYAWPSGSLVVGTGTNHWNWGLALTADGDGEPDRRIQQATTNILADMGALPATPAANISLDDPAAPPTIRQRFPTAGATGLALSTAVTVTFSRPMDPATITSSTFTLTRPDGTAVPAAVTYDTSSFVATLTPAFALDTGTTYTARLAATVRAANGVALAAPESWSFTTRPPDTTAPTVSITAPRTGDIVVAGVQITADATDAEQVAGVQFKLDGSDLGTEDTTAPYSYSWDARGVPAGTHTLTAVARDPSGNSRTSAPVDVTVDPTGMVLALGFEETAGQSVTDSSGKGNAGTISGATRSTAGRFGRALSYDGTNDVVSVPDAASLDLTGAMTLEAWVNPTATSGWRTALLKEQTGGLAYGLYANTDTSRPSAHIHTTSESDVRGTAALPPGTWTHLAATYDGATLRLYVNGTEVANRDRTGSLVNGTGPLKIGGNAVWGEYFGGLIDEVRVYRRTLTAAEIQADMAAPVVSPDGSPPTTPGGLSATGRVGRVDLTWTAATDDVGVVRYNVHRSPTAGFTPTAQNRIGQPTGTTYSDTSATAGTWYYRVTAEDGAGNVGPASAEASAIAEADTTAPTVSITAPSAGATVTGSVEAQASASDDAAVAGVQFRLDGADVGAEDTTAPYSLTWDTRTVANGPHTLTAVARDAAGHHTTSQPVGVQVDNPAVDATGLVGAWGFEEGSGASATDASGLGNAGTIAGATRSTAGRFGEALVFDGVDDMVSVADADVLDLTTGMTLEVWIKPSATMTGWRTAVMKERAAGLSYAIYANSSTNRPSANVVVTTEVDTRGTAALAAGTWTHVATTYDGATLRLYVNGTQVSSRALTGPLAVSTGALRFGANAFAGERFGGSLDEIRIYRRPLTAAEVQADMNRPVVGTVVDTANPTAPGNLTATGGVGQVQLSWGAAADDVGVVRYNVHRGSAAGFTPAPENRVARVAGTSYVDTGLAAGEWFYRVTAEDAAGKIGPPSAEARAVVSAPDTTAPTVTLTAPADGATVSGTVDVAANASDDVGVAGVQFKLGTANLGSEDITAPYSVPWDTVSGPNGSQTLTAVARDAAGNVSTSQAAIVTVDNAPIDTSGLVGAWGFEEGAGASVSDASSAGNDGTIAGAAWTTAGRYGAALRFDGVDDTVSVPDADTLDVSDEMTVEAWVKPTQHAGWRTAVLKEAGGGMAYGLYSSAYDDFPSGHVTAGGEQHTRGVASLTLNRWSHLAVTFDATTLRLYVDGVEVSSKPVAGTVVPSGGPLKFGGNAIWGEYFKGSLDEVRVYRRVLGAAEIRADMDKPVRPDAPPPAGPETLGQFSPPVTWPLVPVHIAMLSDGRVAVWDGFDAALNSERIWDPATGTFSPIPSGRNLFCAAHVTLPDGRLFIAGGHVEAYEGLKDTHIFDPKAGSWFRGTDMARARWYPTATTLPDGRILVISGDNITLGTPNQPVPLTNASETLPEIYDVDTNQWTPLLAGQRRMPLYPFMFVLPNGNVFDAGPDLETRTLDTTTGQWTSVGTSPVDGHSAVMYRPGKIIKSGTWADPDFPNRQVTNRAAAIDMTAANPAWREVAPMNHPRSYHTLTALPDGTVLASGGATSSDGVDPSKAVMAAEIWNPVTDTWTEVDSGVRPRLYHSSAVLLPDGRVLLAGGGAFGPADNETNAEIFSPPYLFKGSRPEITSAPATLRYGDTFAVQTPNAADIQSVSFTRMGSVTHNFDFDQRFMWLDMRREGLTDTLSIDAPTSPNVAPPGYYYVSVVGSDGVPSKGKIVKLERPGTDTQAPTAPASLTATVDADDVTLDWPAATDDVGVTEYRIHRGTTAGFAPTAANRVATVSSGTTYVDRDRPVGTDHYVVVAADAAGNAGPASPEAAATVDPDTTSPTVAITSPAAAATVSGTLSVTADAGDERALASVQFVLDGANLGGLDTAAPYSAAWDTKTAANGPHRLTAVARDAAGNVTTSAAVDIVVDNGAPPTVSLSAPADGATVAGPVDVSADAADDRGVASVQFRLDGADLGAPDTAAPYSTSWDSRTAANGQHTLTAVARDGDGNATTSAPVRVTVQNTAATPPGLVGAYGFDETSGTAAPDASGAGNHGSVSGAAWTAGGRYGGALSFDGVNDWVTVADADTLDLTTAMTLEAWVRPTAVTGYRTVAMKETATGMSYGLFSSAKSNHPAAHVHTTSEQNARGPVQLAAGTWTHMAATYDGLTLRLFVNGTQVATKAITGGAMAVSAAPLRIGGNAVWPEWFSGLIDEVRVYRRALTAAEIQQDMNVPVGPAAVDTAPPGAPGSLTATGGVGTAQLSWTAATDDVGVSRYNVHRSATAGFTPGPGNLVAQVTGTSYADAGLPAGAWHYRVTAEDAAGNVGPPSGEAVATVTADTVAPSVSITAPTGGQTVSGSVDVTATASDAVGVVGVQLRVDGADLGAEDTSAPYSGTWNTGSVANGDHTLTAVARDAAGNRTTSQPVTVRVDNKPLDVSGLVGAYGFDETSGTAAPDASGAGNHGSVSGAAWAPGGRYGGALSFDGVNDWVTVADADTLDLTTAMTLEAWVRPTALTGYRTVAIKETATGMSYALYSSGKYNLPSAHVHTSGEVAARATTQLAANTWTHLAATYDGVTLRLYVNGTQAAAKAVTGSASLSAAPLRIGGNAVWPEWFSGLIDEVRVYRRALTAAEIQQDMNAPIRP